MATRTAGTAAMTENRATMRTCSRAAARPRRRAWTTPQTSRAMTTTRRNTVTALARRSVTTTSCVGGIGVRPASTTKVTRADSKATATAAKPSARGSHPGGGAAAGVTSSAVAAWPTLVINSSRPKRQPVIAREDHTPFGCPPINRWDYALMLLYNNVAGLRQFRGTHRASVADRHHELKWSCR